MATKTPAWQKAYLNQQYQPATPASPKPAFQVGSQPQPQYTPPAGMQEAAKSFQPSLYGQQPAAQPAVDTSWADKLTAYSKDPNAAKTEYQRAMQVYNAKSAIGDTEGAAAAGKWQGQVNTASGGMAAPKPNDGLEPYMKAYMDSINKPVTPFKYDAASDPTYQSQKAIISEDLNKSMANARVEAGASGLRGGSLQNNQLSQLAKQSESRLQNEIIPGLRNQAYGEYKDVITQDRNKNTDLLNYVNTRYGMNRDNITDQRNAVTDANNAEDRGYAKQDRNITRAKDLETRYGVPVNPTEDYAQSLAQVEGLKTVAQKKQEAEGQAAIREQAQKQFETIGRVTAELAPILGLPEGTTTQQATYQNATLKNSQDNTGFDNTLSRDKFNYEKDPTNPDNKYKNQQIETAKAELDQIGKTKPITVQDAQNVLLKTPFITEETTTDALGVTHKTGNVKIDKTGLVQAIAGLGMSDEQMDSLFLLNGISDKEVQEISKQLRAARGN